MKFFKTLFWLVILFVLPLGLALVALQGIEKNPLVSESLSLTAPRVERAKALLRVHDPRRLKDQGTKTIVVTAQELALIANHLIQRVGQGGAEVSLDHKMINVRGTAAVPGLKPTRYVNVDSTLAAEDNYLSFERLRIGKLAIPKRVANALGEFVLMHAYRSADISASTELVKNIIVTPKAFAVTYQWQAGLIDAVRDRIISPHTVSQLKQYNDALVAFGEAARSDATLNELVHYLGTNVDPGTDHVKDNQALIFSLSNYVNGRRMSALIPEVKDWPVPKRRKIIAQGRHDLAQHFTTSAALAVTGGSEIADAIGLYKEIDDADGGSGFSFKDLAADRAGTKFGHEATSTDTDAKRIRLQLAEKNGARAFIPDLTGFEEKMTDATFKTRYGGIEDQRYLYVVTDIDRRVNKSPLYR
ncbi:MAG: hypothetical protein AAF387_19350 [Pseudomonadota bacterium]